jgi:hypothetical protein
MKNCLVSSIVLLVLTGAAHLAAGQKMVIGTRDELHVSVGYNFPMGSKEVGGESCLLTNMKSKPSVEVRYMTSTFRNLSIGGWAGFARFVDWNGPANLYKGTSMSFLSIGPSVMYKFASRGKSIDKLSFCISLSPGISRINVDTDTDSEINGYPNTDPLTVESVRFTLGAYAGMNYIFTNSVGGTLLLGYQYTAADSQIFPDKSYSYLSVRAGVFYRLFNDKKYKYSGL